MTKQDAAKHWHEGAQEELENARVLHNNGKLRGALFHCHLAVEKALKGAYTLEHDREPPRTHNLVELAALLGHSWTNAQKADLADLTQFVIDARYADPVWAEQQATTENCEDWLSKTQQFLSLLLT